MEFDLSLQSCCFVLFFYLPWNNLDGEEFFCHRVIGMHPNSCIQLSL